MFWLFQEILEGLSKRAPSQRMWSYLWSALSYSIWVQSSSLPQPFHASLPYFFIIVSITIKVVHPDPLSALSVLSFLSVLCIYSFSSFCFLICSR